MFSVGRIGFSLYSLRSLDGGLESTTIGSLFCWCFLYLSAYTASTLSNTVFLLLRSCCKHKILVEASVPKHRRLADNDTVIELRKITETYKNDVFMVLFFVAECVLW